MAQCSEVDRNRSGKRRSVIALEDGQKLCESVKTDIQEDVQQARVGQRYGAGNSASGPREGYFENWKKEGGSLYPPYIPLPSRMTPKIIREYHVGPYVYRDLSLAMAEYKHQQVSAGWTI